MVVTITIMMIRTMVAMTLLVSMMVMMANDDRDNFCDCDKGSNDRKGSVKLMMVAMTYSDDYYSCGIT